MFTLRIDELPSREIKDKRHRLTVKNVLYLLCVMQTWLKIRDDDWVPHTYLELEALPCILILSGAEPLGESLPRYTCLLDF